MNKMKYIKLYEDYMNEADGKPKPASPGAKTLYKTYQKIIDLTRNVAAYNQYPALVLWGKALDHQDKEAGNPNKNREDDNRENLKYQEKRAKKSQAEIEALEKQAKALEKGCEPGELRALKSWWAAEKKLHNHRMNADWRVTDTALNAYKILGDEEALKKNSKAAQEYEKKDDEFDSAALQARYDLRDEYKI